MSSPGTPDGEPSTRMHPQGQLALLVEHVTEWNRWRGEHPDDDTDVTRPQSTPAESERLVSCFEELAPLPTAQYGRCLGHRVKVRPLQKQGPVRRSIRLYAGGRRHAASDDLRLDVATFVSIGPGVATTTHVR